MNFNSSSTPDYALNTSLIEEVISLYGVLTKFLITTKINEDPTVFGDYSHLKSDNAKIYDIYMMPENSEEWDMGDYSFNPLVLQIWKTFLCLLQRAHLMLQKWMN